MVFYFCLIHVIKFFWVPLWLLKSYFLWHSFPLSGLRHCFFSDVWRSWCIFISEEELPTTLHPPQPGARSLSSWLAGGVPIGMGMITGKCEPSGKVLSWGLGLDSSEDTLAAARTSPQCGVRRACLQDTRVSDLIRRLLHACLWVVGICFWELAEHPSSVAGSVCSGWYCGSRVSSALQTRLLLHPF